MTVATHSVAFPKAGHAAVEFEDAHALAADAWPVRAAVTDGATESAFSGPWARTLAEAYVNDSDAMEDPEAWLRACRLAWAEDTVSADAPLPWYAAAKAEEGAHAAFLGVSLQADGAYTAHAVGDCCLLHLREGALHRAWPMDDPDAFTYHPALLSSRPDAAVPDVQVATGEVEAGDRLWLATDAVAAYLLRSHRAADLARMSPPKREATLRAAQASGELRNDDSTLLTLSFSADA
ncbi:MAG: hypothetical protein GVY12_00430 [Bacteroidetes bacterium]|nr:hypothetical protein [Bacteroidota bacterium]